MTVQPGRGEMGNAPPHVSIKHRLIYTTLHEFCTTLYAVYVLHMQVQGKKENYKGYVGIGRSTLEMQVVNWEVSNKAVYL